MVIYNEIRCSGCGRVRLPMDMHDKDICKVCWLKKYRSRYRFRNKTTKMQDTNG